MTRTTPGNAVNIVLAAVPIVEEEICPGDRVQEMQPHTGRITREIALDLPRPRDRASPRFTELRQQILHDMGAFSALAA
nr:hypothetical protein [uncultured Rhodopila sp.]